MLPFSIVCQVLQKKNALPPVSLRNAYNSRRWLGCSAFGRVPADQKASSDVPSSTESSWDSLIDKHIKCGDLRHALALFERVQHCSLSACTFVALLNACTKVKDVVITGKIHAKVSGEGLLEKNLFIGSSLVNAYAKCGALTKAQEVFDTLSRRDVVTWTALIAGYAHHAQGKEALSCFERMRHANVSMNAVTLACCLKACALTGDLDKGEDIHFEIANKGFLERDIVLGSALVDMYAKCGALERAEAVFAELQFRDVACWNAMITGYAQHDLGNEALSCYDKMQLTGFSPDAVTFASSLKACGCIGALDKGKEVHAEIARQGLLSKNLVLSNALTDLYAKCGDLQKALEVFEKIPVPNVVSWTALIAGYAEHEQSDAALICYEQMQEADISPTAITFASALKACGNIGAIDKGMEIHAAINKRKILKNDLVLSNTLVDMYCKCGMLAKAQKVFNSIPNHTVISWTTLITGYSQIGDINKAFHVFDRMRKEDGKPNPITFVSVLNACSHAGRIDMGQFYLQAMNTYYGIVPTLAHHICMVDLLSRAGQLDNALAIVKGTPFYPSNVMWLTVLGACRKWGNVELGKLAFEQALQLDEMDSSAYITMYNIYTEAGMFTDAEKVEAMRVGRHGCVKSKLPPYRIDDDLT